MYVHRFKKKMCVMVESTNSITSKFMIDFLLPEFLSRRKIDLSPNTAFLYKHEEEDLTYVCVCMCGGCVGWGGGVTIKPLPTRERISR